jgi:hypothetical protein
MIWYVSVYNDNAYMFIHNKERTQDACEMNRRKTFKPFGIPWPLEDILVIRSKGWWKVVISSYEKVNEKVEVKYRISAVYMYTSGSHISIGFSISGKGSSQACK